jgi:hypothetical protein
MLALRLAENGNKTPGKGMLKVEKNAHDIALPFFFFDETGQRLSGRG